MRQRKPDSPALSADRLRRLVQAGILAIAALACAGAPGFSQSPKPAPAEETSPRVRLLLDLLADDEVQKWVERQRAAEKAKPPAPSGETGISGALGTRLRELHAMMTALVSAVPTVPTELARAAGRLQSDMSGHGLVRAVLLVVAFVAIGGLAEWALLIATRGALRIDRAAAPGSVRQRLQAVGVRLATGLIRVAAFTAGSVGAFLALHWPPLLHAVVLEFLLAVVALRLVIVIGRLLFAPQDPELRILPLAPAAAAHWHRRMVTLAAWFVFGLATVEAALSLGVPEPAVRVFGLALAIGLLVIGFEMIWRRPAELAGRSRATRYKQNWLLCLYFAVLWTLRLLGMFGTFWLLLVLGVVPAAIGATKRAIDHLLRPAAQTTETTPISNLYRVGLERGLRAAWIVGGALLLAHVWNVDMIEMAASDGVSTRLLRGALTAVVIVLVADFGWQILRVLIDDRLAAAHRTTTPNTEEARRAARARTLLPIAKNVLFIILLVMAVLMALASLGVEIGPLIAGAGVVGVAVGFGAQTLVRDVFSGMFYLMDDAFRVGEYIQSGNYKGTVESFSLRSIKLRHQRGAVYTVPFGVLGAIQNMSRDWVIEKMMIGITYDSDIDLAKKLIKQVGKDLAAIPEFKESILEPLKMQGVENFGDFAIQIRLKMKTRPGEQFMIKRRALAMIKKAFDENGIRFAYPTVQVAGGEANAAAAQAMLKAAQPPAVAT
jgi:small-conductance mechanosensitive channel